jgi:hypothetical protein
MTNISLTFTKKSSNYSWVFPIPTSNIYQRISHLQLPRFSKNVQLDFGNKLMIVSAAQACSLSFRQECQKESINWSLINLKKSADDSCFSKDQYINYTDVKMQTLAKDWTAGEKDLKQIVFLLYEKTLNYLTYGQPIKGLNPYSQALKDQLTDCGGFSTFLVTLLQTQGLSSRLAVGYLFKDSWWQKVKKRFDIQLQWSDLQMHAWLEIETADSQWLALDPAIDWRYRHGLSKRFAAFANVPADRLLLSYGHNHHLKYLNENYSWPILQHPQLIKEIDV